jgi:hypothetical protein
MKRAQGIALFLSAAVALLAGVLCAPQQVRSEFLFNDYDTARQLDM